MDMQWQDFLSFRKMITPLIINILFYIMVAVCVILGLVEIIAGAVATYGGGQWVVIGLLTLLLGPVFSRVYCEIVIVAFRMLEALQEIRWNTGGAQAEVPAAKAAEEPKGPQDAGPAPAGE